MGLKVKENGKWVSIGKVKYTIAKESDFSGPANEPYKKTRYIGTSENIVIPPKIGENYFTKYERLFMDNSFAKLSIISANPVTSFESLFSNCSNLTELDLSSFDTSYATSFSSLFSNCSNLTELDLSAFDTSKVTMTDYMFLGCTSLTELDLSAFDTSSVTNMYAMFLGCTSLTELDLSAFDTSSVTNMSSMFTNCSALQTVYARTEADATKFRNSSGFPSGATVIVKQ